MKFYKIRNKHIELYSSGGHYPTWEQKGKMWTHIGFVKSHLTMIKKIILQTCNVVYLSTYLEDSEIIEYNSEIITQKIFNITIENNKTCLRLKKHIK